MNKRKQKKQAIKKKIIWVVILTILCAGAGTLLVLFNNYRMNTQPVTTEDSPIIFTVAKGSTAKTVTDDLQTAGIIRDADAAKIYVKLNKIGSLYAGNYLLNKNMTLKQIYAEICNAANAIVEEATITISPGDWAKDAAAKIAEGTNVTAEQLMAKWNDVDYIYKLIEKYEVITEEVFNSERCYLEGYIFPDTYKFFKYTTAEQITEKILDQTEKIYQKYKSQIESSGLTIHEAYTLASMVLFEASNPEEQPIVASVFYNRLHSKSAEFAYLRSCVTVCYTIYDISDWAECGRRALVAEGSYNTYLNKGLPPGPVSNANESAIAAVANPAQTDYYFFIGYNGKTYFAKTYAEQQANEKKYLGK